MKGIQYINDNAGNPIKVVVDLQLYGKEFALFLQQLSAKYENTNNNSSNSLFGGDNQTRPSGDVVGPIGNNSSTKVSKLLQTAQSFLGTPYRTGGTTSSGMDCSGFTQTVFNAIGIKLPRVSRDQSTVGQSIAKSSLQVGDLLFFATSTPNVINHVAVVSNTTGGQVKFLHASTSRGVMEADLALDYYQKAYMTARRVL